MDQSGDFALVHRATNRTNCPTRRDAGQTVCTAFVVILEPQFIAQIPLGDLIVPSGKLRNKKSINLVYVRPGARSQTA